jgi:hypothetical protein
MELDRARSHGATRATGADTPDLGSLQPREAELLRLLLARHGRVVGRTELARHVGLTKTPRRVDVHLVAVRRVVGDALINVRARGWMLDSAHGLDTLEAALSQLPDAGRDVAPDAGPDVAPDHARDRRSDAVLDPLPSSPSTPLLAPPDRRVETLGTGDHGHLVSS